MEQFAIGDLCFFSDIETGKRNVLLKHSLICGEMKIFLLQYTSVCYVCAYIQELVLFSTLFFTSYSLYSFLIVKVFSDYVCIAFHQQKSGYLRT